VSELKTAVLEAIPKLGRRKVAGDGADFEEGDDFYDRVFTQRLNLWRIDEVVPVLRHAARTWTNDV
jgi:hypothetical protein